MANLLLATRESDSLRSENPRMSQPSRGLVLGEKSGSASADVSDRMTSAERSSEPTSSPPVQTASALPLSPVASPDLDAPAARLGSEAADGRTGLDANEASETTASSPPTAPPAVG